MKKYILTVVFLCFFIPNALWAKNTVVIRVSCTIPERISSSTNSASSNFINQSQRMEKNGQFIKMTTITAR